MRLNQSQIDKFIKGQTTKERFLNEVCGLILCDAPCKDDVEAHRMAT